MTKMDRWTSKRAIGVALVLVSMLIALSCSTIGHPPSANATASLQLQPTPGFNPFSVFCYFYYNDGKDTTADQDTATCQQESSAFLSLLEQDSPNGFTQWSQVSLANLAQQSLLIDPQTKTAFSTQQDFVKTITDPDLKALVSGSGNGQNIGPDPDFLSTLWNYDSTTDTLPKTQLTFHHSPSGTADLEWNAQKKTLTVTINLTGLAPSSTHPAHIHNGSCETADNGILYPLNSVMADNKGDSTTITVIKNVATGIPLSGWFLNVHNGPTLSPAKQKSPIACGDIMNANTLTSTNQFVTLTLGPTKSPSQAVNGVANLSLSGHTLTVTITMSGLDPTVKQHIAHIHQGTCDAQGGVLIPLSPVAVNVSGIGTSTTTKTVTFNSIPAIGWYINVHLASTTQELNTQTGFDPIACGDVIA